jgi:putative flippase GtrA
MKWLLRFILFFEDIAFKIIKRFRFFKKLKRSTFHQFIGYLFCGTTAMLSDLASFALLTNIFGVYYLISNIFSSSIGITVNFTLNKYLNFKNKSKKVAQQFGIFILVSLSSMVLNTTLLWIFVTFFNNLISEVLGFFYLYFIPPVIFAKMLSIAIVMFWSFFWHKRITFNVLK